jgi:alkylation response protein AidB-like acyl-CoA dehydrogenase
VAAGGGYDNPVDMVAVAQRIADEVLFPAALATDASDVVPRELLDTLAGAGLYGAGMESDFRRICAVQEALASGCLTTAFIWAQHQGLVHELAAGGDTDARAKWLDPLAAGEIRAGLGLGGALPKPTLHAQPVGRDWLLDGVSPFVSGWERIDVIHVAARGPDNQVVGLIVDAAEGPSLQTQRLALAALNATATVRATFSKLLVTADRVTGQHPASGGTPPEVLRLHAALALGVASRCCRLLGNTSLDCELNSLRTGLDQLGPRTAEARAAAGQFAVRAAAALMTSEGSRSLLVADHGQRLMREAMFTLVYALRPASRTAVLASLGASGSG